MPRTDHASARGRSIDGEERPEFSVRAVTAGLLIGVLLCTTNTHLGLQSGWISTMSLQASLLGFGLFKLLPHHRFFKDLTVHENIVLQTTAVATGTLPLAAGLVGVIPALAQLSPSLDGRMPIVLSAPALVAWCFAVAFFGVFLAVPLRRQVIVKEQLVFPTGMATAQIISVLHKVPPPTQGSTRRRREHSTRSTRSDRVDDEDEAGEAEESRGGADELEHGPAKSIDRKSWMALIWSFSASAAFTVSCLLDLKLEGYP